jgi:hypothetical protein
MSPGIVDLSPGGLRCVLPEAFPLVAPGAAVSGPFLLEAETETPPICLDVAGRVSWQHSTDAVTHLGIAFGELTSDQAEGVHRFLSAVSRKRGRR